MPHSLRMTAVQMNATVGDLRGNADEMLLHWREHDEVCDLVIFPELALCGYPPEDLVRNTMFQRCVREEIKRLCDEAQSLSSAALVPTIWCEDDRVFNTVLLIEHGEIQHVFKKRALPNYGVFDEPRVFDAGDMPEPYAFRGVNLGILICEDIWTADIPKHLKAQGAEFLIAINGSPYFRNKDRVREDVVSRVVQDTGLATLYLNLIGGQDELVFDGQSFFMDRDGVITHRCAAYVADVMHCDIAGHADEQFYTVRTRLSPDDKPSQDRLVFDALVTGTRDYVHKNGFRTVLIGLSGGVDSALVAAIAVAAFGAENVHCVMLPSAFTSEDSLSDAKQCAQNLGVQYDIIPIIDAVKTFESTIPNLAGVAHENTQSRIRGTILMGLSNMTGAMVLTTGNKSEMAVGYCTLYGDMNGGFNPLKDVYKTDVFALCHWYNTHYERQIPENIITKPPTAELRGDQKDEDSLPPYDVLDDILRMLIEYDADDAGLCATDRDSYAHLSKRCRDYDADEVKRVAKLLKISEYKRFQAAPGVRVTSRGFGRDRRYPMTNGFVNIIPDYRDKI